MNNENNVLFLTGGLKEQKKKIKHIKHLINNKSKEKIIQNNNKIINPIHKSEITKKELLKENQTRIKEISYLKSNLINYLLNEKLEYVNENEIENYFTEQNSINKKKYNLNLAIIKKKKDLEKNLNLKIKFIVFENVKIHETGLEKLNEEIKEIKRKIQETEHLIDTYKYLFNRTYKTHYLLQKRVDEERKYLTIYNAQYEEYNIFKKHSLSTVNKQNEFLKDLKNYHDVEIMSYDRQKLEKIKIYNKLDFELYIIKKETQDIQEQIDNLKKQKKNIQTILLNENKKYNKIHENYLYHYHNFHSLNTKLFNIYHILKVKNLIDVIKEFNIIRKKYKDLSFQNLTYNKEISNLNSTLTILNNQYEQMLKDIENKKYKKIEQDNENNELIISKISKNKYFNHIISENFKEKSKTLKLVLTFLVNNMKKIIQSLIHPIHHHFFSFHQIYFPKYNIFFSKKSYLSLQIDFQNIDFDSLFIKAAISLFNNFWDYFFILFTNTSNIVYYDYDKKNSISLINNSNYIRKSKAITQKIKIYSLYSKEMILNFDKQINSAIVRQSEKQKILGRNEKDIFLNSNTQSYIVNLKNENKKKNKLTSLKKSPELITRKDLFNQYLNYNVNDKNSNLLKLHSNRNIYYIEKFTNKNINDKLINQNLKDQRRLKLKEKTQGMNNKSQEITNTIQRNVKEIVLTNNSMEIESNEEDDIIKENEKKNKNKKNILKKIKLTKKKYENPSSKSKITEIYMRLNELRKLELHFGKEKNNYILDQNEFNSIYYNYKHRIKNQEIEKKKPMSNSLIKSNFPSILKKHSSIDYSINMRKESFLKDENTTFNSKNSIDAIKKRRNSVSSTNLFFSNLKNRLQIPYKNTDLSYSNNISSVSHISLIEKNNNIQNKNLNGIKYGVYDNYTSDCSNINFNCSDSTKRTFVNN